MSWKNKLVAVLESIIILYFVIKIKYDYPERGYIYDRNGVLLVANQPSYDIMVIPRELKNTDTLEFCKLLFEKIVWYIM